MARTSSEKAQKKSALKLPPEVKAERQLVDSLWRIKPLSGPPIYFAWVYNNPNIRVVEGAGPEDRA